MVWARAVAIVRATPQRNVFTLIRGQVATRNGLWQLWIHAASMAEPPKPNRRRHARFGGSVLGHRPRSNGRPEPDPVLAPGHRRPARRGNLTPIATNL